MPRPKKWPPTVLRHHTGNAFIRVNGKEYYLGTYGSQEAQQEYARLIGELANSNGKPIEPRNANDGLLVAEVIGAWLDGPGKKYSAEGRELKQFTYAFRPLMRLYSKLPAHAFTADELEEVQTAMATGSWMTDEERRSLSKPKRPLGWCANVINRRIVRIRTVWKWATRKKLVPPGAHAQLQTLRGVRSNHAAVRTTEAVKPPSWEDVSAALKRCPKKPAAMLALIWWTGMRPDEVRRLNLDELDRSGEVWRYDPAKHKNAWRGQERIVPIGPKGQEILLPWIAAAEKASRQLVFPGIDGDVYRVNSFAQATRRACIRAGVKPFQPKALRHAAKRRITRATGSMDAARQMLGQKSIGTTAGYDSEVDIEYAVEVARLLG